MAEAKKGAEETSVPSFLTVGLITGPHGIKGELKVEVMTDFPERFAKGRSVYLDQQPRGIESVRHLKQLLIIKLAGVDTRDQAEALRNRELEIPLADAMPLPPGEFYTYQIIGLTVWTTTGRLLGRVVDILTTGSNDVYVVDMEGKEILIPAIEDVVLEISPENGRITIEPMEGLF